MSIEQKLKSFMSLLIREAKANPAFGYELARIFESAALDSKGANTGKAKNRRNAAVLDPILMLQTKGESALKEALDRLDTEQLKDIVSEQGLDPTKLVLKWRNPGKIVLFILDAAKRRTTKGNAFR